jgi:hypothetical protein
MLRVENSQLRSGPSVPPAHQASYPPPAQPATDPYTKASVRPELPPLRSLGGSMPNGPESMTGIQYEGGPPPAGNGYRPGQY